MFNVYIFYGECWEEALDIEIKLRFGYLDRDFYTQYFIKELRLKCDSTCDMGISQVKSRATEVTSFLFAV